MSRSSHLALGAVLILAGLLLALVWPDAEFLWFRGRPLGLVLAVLGVFDLLSGLPRPAGGRRR